MIIKFPEELKEGYIYYQINTHNVNLLAGYHYVEGPEVISWRKWNMSGWQKYSESLSTHIYNLDLGIVDPNFLLTHPITELRNKAWEIIKMEPKRKSPGERLSENVIYYGKREDYDQECFLFKKDHLILVTQKRKDGNWSDYEIPMVQTWNGNFDSLENFTLIEELLTHPSQRLREKAKELLK